MQPLCWIKDECVTLCWQKSAGARCIQEKRNVHRLFQLNHHCYVTPASEQGGRAKHRPDPDLQMVQSCTWGEGNSIYSRGRSAETGSEELFLFPPSGHSRSLIRWTVARAELQWQKQAGMWVSRQRGGGDWDQGSYRLCWSSQADVIIRVMFPHHCIWSSTNRQTKKKEGWY